MVVLCFVKDLAVGSKIRAACEGKTYRYTPARSNESFDAALAKSPGLVIIDLNIQGADPFSAIQAAKSSGGARLVGFYSHIDPTPADKAAGLGMTEIYRRSKFFSNLDEIL